MDYFHPIISPNKNGFWPQSGEMDKLKIREEDHVQKESYDFDPLKLYYMERYAESLEDKIVFCVSPIWYGMDSKQLTPIIELCKKKGIEFIDFSNNPKYVRNDYYFTDGSHMNSIGADEFTKDLIIELRNRNIIK